MLRFYIIIIVISAVCFTADMVLRYMERLPGFGVARRLFSFKGETIPLEKFLPETITMLFLYFLVFGIVGLVFEARGLPFYFSLPAGLMSGSLFCFILQYPVKNLAERAQGTQPPKGEAAAGLEAYALEEIEGDGYGKISLHWRGEDFTLDAVSANDTDIAAFERVIVVLEMDGFYVVEHISEVYEAL